MTLKRALVILFVCLFIAPFSEASSLAVGSKVERASSERALLGLTVHDSIWKSR